MEAFDARKLNWTPEEAARFEEERARIHHQYYWRYRFGEMKIALIFVGALIAVVISCLMILM